MQKLKRRKKRPKQEKLPPDWLLRIGKWSPTARREICQRGGRNSIHKLHLWLEAQKLRRERLEREKAREFIRRRIECNEHIVPIDDSVELLELVDDSSVLPRRFFKPPF
jgi:hypothetical protein